MHSDDEMVYLRDVVETLIYMTDEDSDGVEEVMQLPTIEIIRCRECKYWNTNGCRDGVGECEWAYYMTKPDDFCSYGEREGK